MNSYYTSGHETQHIVSCQDPTICKQYTNLFMPVSSEHFQQQNYCLKEAAKQHPRPDPLHSKIGKVTEAGTNW